MIINIENTVQLILIIGFICSGFKYIVISPLQKDIKNLMEVFNDLNKNIEVLQGQRHGLDKRLGIVEEKIKAINYRISTSEEALQKCPTSKCCSTKTIS